MQQKKRGRKKALTLYTSFNSFTVYRTLDRIRERKRGEKKKKKGNIPTNSNSVRPDQFTCVFKKRGKKRGRGKKGKKALHRYCSLFISSVDATRSRGYGTSLGKEKRGGRSLLCKIPFSSWRSGREQS